MPTPHASPPASAVWLLSSCLPAHDRDAIVGDVIEQFENRIDARRPFARTWFWAQAVLFAVAAASHRAHDISPNASGRHLMGRLRNGFRHAVRRLRYDWRYSAGVILITSIGIGPAAAMWSTVDHVLLRPLKYRDPDRIGLVRITIGQIQNHPGLSPAEALDLRASGLFESVEIENRQNEVSYGPQENLRALTQVAFTPGMLSMLGVSPLFGRDFSADDLPPNLPPPTPGAPPAPRPPPPPMPILLDYTTWQTQFGGDRSVEGRVVPLSGRPAVIVGVLPDGFRLATGRAVPQRIDIYMPTRLGNARNAWQFPTLVRLKAGASFEQTQAGLDALAATMKRDHPEIVEYAGELKFTISPVLADMTRASAPALRAAIAGVLLLLVIALANATALVVARLRVRERDLAIRSAIGASRATLVSEVLLESLVLSLCAAIAGACLAVACAAGIRSVVPRTVPRWEEIAVGWDLLLYSASLALAGLLCSGLIPVWKVSRQTAWNALRAGSVQGGRAEGAVSRFILVGSQIALTVVLVYGCAQLTRSAMRLNQIDLGFDANVLTLRVPYDGRIYDSPQKRGELYQRIRDRIRQVPHVTSVGVVSHVPLGGGAMMDGYQADLSKEVTFEQSANYMGMTPGYLSTVHIPLVLGRDITDEENVFAQNVVVVDESLVRTVFGSDTNVIGRTLRLGWGLPNSRIVGVVAHARIVEVGRQVRPQIYAPLSTLFSTTGAGLVVVRTDGNTMAMAPAIEAAIKEIGPGRAISNIAMLNDNVTAATSTLRAITGLVTALAVSAGLLSAVGLYLVISFVVYQRRRSTAIRSALGATRQQVMWSHFKLGVALLAVALPVGLLLSLVSAPVFGDLVYGVNARDGVSASLAIVLAIVVSAVGMYVPVRRAAGANVIKILREGV